MLPGTIVGMVSCSAEDVEAIRSAAGESLRVVAEYDESGYDIHYIRPDVEAKVQDVADNLHDELILQGIGREYLEQLFQAGGLHCSMHRLDEITAFHFVDEGTTGLFVATDSDADFHLATFADVCRDAL